MCPWSLQKQITISLGLFGLIRISISSHGILRWDGPSCRWQTCFMYVQRVIIFDRMCSALFHRNMFLRQRDTGAVVGERFRGNTIGANNWFLLNDYAFGYQITRSLSRLANQTQCTIPVVMLQPVHSITCIEHRSRLSTLLLRTPKT